VCGIVAVVNKDAGVPVERRVLTEMAERIKYRGPDEEGDFVDGCVGFYHKRLSVIDLVSGRQPMTCGPATIVFNGEIYNYIELRNSLESLGRVFRTNSDTEVILQLYLEYGPDCVSRLNGMFAFIIYDRAAQKILAARDHFGIKPLYYYSGKGVLLFASEIKALLAHPAVVPEPDYSAIREYLVFQYVLGEETFFRGVRKLPPGRYQTVDLRSFQTRTVKYWEPDFAVDTSLSEESSAERLRELLEDTVRIQMRSDVPLGTYLSGGLDSSLVTALSSRNSAAAIKTFTGAFHEGPEFNEASYAREVAAACGAQNFVVYPTEKDFIELLPKLVYHMDEPAAGPGLFPQYMVSRMAAGEVKVVLGGQGGDEIFGGYARYVIAYLEQALKGAILETSDEGEHIVTLQSILPNLPFLRDYLPMMRRFWHQGLFEGMDRRYFRLIDRMEGNSVLLSPEFRSAFDRERIFAKFQAIFNDPNTRSYYNKMVHYDMVASLPALLQVEDRVTMAVSLESRVPLLDFRIVDLVARMPPAMKFKGAEMKYILKKAVGDIVPSRVLDRKDKMGFPVPLHLWARNRVRGYFHDILLSAACRERGVFDWTQVERLIDQEEAFGRRLWGLVNIELWFQTFIDRAPRGQT
jgi:asparagine synthase (glutamine-hydrolysing)